MRKGSFFVIVSESKPGTHNTQEIKMPVSNHPVALITGASRGLGLALARELALHNWRLILDARGVEALDLAHRELSDLTRVISIPGDVSELLHRQALVDAATSLGSLDLLINNASQLGPSPLPGLVNYPLSALEQVYRVNVFAPLALIQMLQSFLKPGAVIINVSSDAGLEAYPGWGGYGSSKAALEQLSAVLADENPQWHIYWIDPGDMRTQMHQEAYPGEDISNRPLPDASIPGFRALLSAKLPSGRYKVRELEGVSA
jgi:NAD(P)-dependent dehydrogenase (short-subunit alcohol dehydrogenase family)